MDLGYNPNSIHAAKGVVAFEYEEVDGVRVVLDAVSGGGDGAGTTAKGIAGALSGGVLQAVQGECLLLPSCSTPVMMLA